ncbi:Hypothetical protein PHPALM_37262 [Phytophthora palmivora]|uniref:Uncharacterized protein n=1 Tax=Phytophthora palmivora TaxID=4796 RepID=A0A2P4WXX3_9STRA|nr:Hypothetical protein PHPALM_37262 [Phytophthora palmivora]
MHVLVTFSDDMSEVLVDDLVMSTVLVTFSDDMSEVLVDDLVMSTHFEPSRLDLVDAATDHMVEMDTSVEGGPNIRVGEIVFPPENVFRYRGK